MGYNKNLNMGYNKRSIGKISLTSVMIILISLSLLYVYFYNLTNINLQSNITTSNGIYWWFDINVYVVNKSRSDPNKYDFYPAVNASVVAFTSSSSGYEPIAATYATANADNSKATAHIEFVVKDPPNDYSFDLTVFALFSLNLTEEENNTVYYFYDFWGGISFRMYTDFSKALIPKLDYFDLINKYEFDSRMAKNYTESILYNQKVKELLQRYNVTFIVDEHTINIYIIEPFNYTKKVGFVGDYKINSIKSKEYSKALELNDIYFSRVPCPSNISWPTLIDRKNIATVSKILLAEFHSISNSEVEAEVAYSVARFDVGLSVTLPFAVALTTTSSFGKEFKAYLGARVKIGPNDEYAFILHGVKVKIELWRFEYTICSFGCFCKEVWLYIAYFDDREGPFMGGGRDYAILKNPYGELDRNNIELVNSTNPREAGAFSSGESTYYYSYAVGFNINAGAKVWFITVYTSGGVTIYHNRVEGKSSLISYYVKYYDDQTTKNWQIWITDAPTSQFAYGAYVYSWNSDVLVYADSTIFKPGNWVFLVWKIKK